MPFIIGFTKNMPNKTINFCSSKEPYFDFSNFDRRHPINLDGKIWPSTEHYFQAKKFEGTEHEEAVRLTKTPAEAAEMGRRRDLPLRKDWEQVKDKVMYDACYAKFTQFVDIQALLLSTGDATLVEHTKNDSYWGDGGDGTGENMLGRILMEIRTVLQSKP